jgi:sugar lactone lactonase YvrE
MQETPDWKCVFDGRMTLAEEPLWCAEEGALYWIECFELPALHRLEIASGAHRSWPLPEDGATFALKKTGGALVALATGLAELDFRSGKLARLLDAPFDTHNYRFNDGRCDRAGRFWVGTLREPHSKEPEGGGAFYRYDGKTLAAAVPGITIANGLAWSPDNRVMYVADRPNWRILAFDFDFAQGTASNRRVFATVPEGQIPDGATVDVEGGYWIAIATAGRILRFLPDGRLDRDIKSPVTLTTKVAFGGPGHRTLFATTGSRLYDAEKLKREPLAGKLIAFDAGVAGIPEPRFAPSA